jgi:hypothetical protein
MRASYAPTSIARLAPSRPSPCRSSCRVVKSDKTDNDMLRSSVIAPRQARHDRAEGRRSTRSRRCAEQHGHPDRHFAFIALAEIARARRERPSRTRKRTSGC